jgi:radical SAM superfamily enzyme YgiQ (UPF0313 family)
MVVQRDSTKDVIKRCKELGAKIVAGGPLFTTGYEEFDGVDHFVLNEAEITLPAFLQDLSRGCARHIYTSDKYPDITTTPIPAWELINTRKYSSMSVQYSRGCPFDCEFCDIVVLNGHVPRTKTIDQLLAELDALYKHGWRSGVFIVDDNFIGNKRKLKTETLPALSKWMKDKGYPFSFLTEASMNLSDDEELMQLMVEANFDTVFVGVETTNEESLSECGKSQNINRDLVASVKKLQSYGLQVQGGFIVGFDNDPLSIFENLINFIQRSGIVTAMVGLLNAPPGTKLYQRLKKENRLMSEFSGDNTDCSMNFIPKMDHKILVNGYHKIIDTIYSPKQYYERVKTLLKQYKPTRVRGLRLRLEHLVALVKSVWFLGIKERGRKYYWKLIAWTLVRRPQFLPLSISLSIYGFHFRKVVKGYVQSLASDNS